MGPGPEWAVRRLGTFYHGKVFREVEGFWYHWPSDGETRAAAAGASLPLGSVLVWRESFCTWLRLHFSTFGHCLDMTSQKAPEKVDPIALLLNSSSPQAWCRAGTAQRGGGTEPALTLRARPLSLQSHAGAGPEPAAAGRLGLRRRA